MTLTIALDCGCCITLLSEGEYHRPTVPKPCAAHVFLAARSALLLTVLGSRVRVKVIPDDKN